MKYGDAVAFRMALEDRLNRQAKEARVDRAIVRFRKFVAFERLLARLSHVSPDGWVVKGGLALEYRFGERARTTLDLDITTHDIQRNIGELLIVAATLDMGDYFSYDVEAIRQLDLEDTNGVQRFTILSDLSGRRFEALTVDIGVSSDTIEPPAMRISTNILSFAEVDPVSFWILPLEIHLAEKLHAYTRPYGEDRQNTRVKDLIDIVLIASMANFELTTLAAAIRETFTSRGSQQIPERLPPPPDHWRAPYALLAREVEIAERLDVGYAAAADFLDPVLHKPGNHRRFWNAERFGWIADETEELEFGGIRESD